MAAPLPRARMTAEDLFVLPDDGYRYELTGGGLVRMTPTGAEHGAVTARLGQILTEHVVARGAGVCCGAETGFILRRGPDVVRAPDAAFVARERIPKTGVPRSYWPFAPDLAVEVVSPSDRLGDVRAKIDECLEAGTRLVWLVEPAARVVHVHRPRREAQVVGGGGVLTGADVLPEFRCAVRRLFSWDEGSSPPAGA